MGGYRSKPETTKLSIYQQKTNTTYAVKEMCGWRAYNQDAFIALDQLQKNEDLSLFAIFDGHGGSNVAHYAAKHLTKTFLSNETFRSRQFDRILRETFLKLDQSMQTEAGKEELAQIHKEQLEKQNTSKNYDPLDAGSTALVCLISSMYVYVANAGDCRAICSIKGELVELSNDHRITNPTEITRVKNAGGYIEKDRVNGELTVTRGLGDFSFKRNPHEIKQNQIITAFPEVKKIKRSGIDFIFLGCDGLWEKKSSQEMNNYLEMKLKQKNMSAVLQDLLDDQISKDQKCPQGMDNMTAILIKIHDTE